MPEKMTVKASKAVAPVAPQAVAPTIAELPKAVGSITFDAKTKEYVLRVAPCQAYASASGKSWNVAQWSGLTDLQIDGKRVRVSLTLSVAK